MPALTSVQESEVRGVRVVAFRGELDIDSAPGLCVTLNAARLNGTRHILLDLSEMSFCDSQGLRALIGEDREMRAAGKRFCVIGPADEDVMRIFELTGMGEWLRLYPSRAEALERITSASR
jgi:anti-anti-sigma factor